MFNTRQTSALSMYVTVRDLRIEPAAYLQDKNGQLFQLVEDVYSCFLPDAYYLFHRFMIFGVQQSVCLCVRSYDFHSSRIRRARFFIIVRFCVFQTPLQDGLPTRNAYDIRQVVRPFGGGSDWLRHGGGWLRCLA